MRHKIIVINGPTGVGKSTVIKKLMKLLPKLNTGVTYTTRPERKGSKEDKIMHHVSVKEFERKIRDDELLEWAEFSGNWYGSAKQENLEILEKKPLLMNIEYKGLKQLKRKFPDILSIFIMPESVEQLEERLKRRKLSKVQLQRRLNEVKIALKHASEYDYQVINREGLVGRTAQEIARIIKAYGASK